MKTFSMALDELQSSMETIERALDEGHEPVLPLFEPVDLTGSVTTEDLDRYELLMARMVVCQTRMQLAKVKVLEEMSDLGRRRSAATAYATYA